MVRLLSPICPFCETKWLLNALRQPWQNQRTLTTMEKRRPSRMELSPKVSQTPPQTSPAGKTVKRRTNSPFGGMNITEAKIRNGPRGRISQAEEKRSTRFKNAPSTKEKSKAEPFKALKMQRALSEVSYGHRAAVKEKIAEVETFRDFDLLSVIRDSVSPQALQGLTDISPTPIQRLAIPSLLGSNPKRTRRKTEDQKEEMKQFLLAAETGSGKTLAYLLPIIDAIKRAEVLEKEQEAIEAEKSFKQNKRNDIFALQPPPLSNEPHPTTGRPRALILLPTSELVDQVGALAKALSHTIKFRAALLSASYSGEVIRNRLFSPSGVDIVISTPHLLSSIAESNPNILARVTHLVIDEADSLLDRSFAPTTTAILDRATPSMKQLVLCSATIPRSLDSFLRKRFPDIHRLTTPNLHAIPRRVQLAVVDVEKDPYKGNKDLACADTIYGIGREAVESETKDKPDPSAMKHMIVFVNEREKTIELSTYLRGKGIDATALSRDSNERKTAETLAAFTGTMVSTIRPSISVKSQDATNKSSTFQDSAAEVAVKTSTYSPLRQTYENGTQAPVTQPKRILPNVKVLVMTDLGSRGIDTLAVRHVILYDVPHTSIDFIHRLGRVGRMGRRGRGVVLIGKGDRRDVVREVREGMFRGTALI